MNEIKDEYVRRMMKMYLLDMGKRGRLKSLSKQ